MTELDIVGRWLVVLLVLGWMAGPIVRRLVPAMPMAGYFLARPFAILLVSYAAWLTSSFRLAPFQVSVWSVGLAVLGVMFLLVMGLEIRGRRSAVAWRPNMATVTPIVMHEIVFVLVFAGFAWLRGYTPDITFTEKPMELMLLNSALHAQSMPPADGWLAGQTVNYYYLGYVLAAALTTLANAPIGYAFNLMLTTVVALGASIAFGLAGSLWAACRDEKQPRFDWSASAVGAVAAYMLVAAGNLVGGWRWLNDAAGTAAASWWGGIGWASSRVIVDHIGAGERPTINEFPWFSFILGDLHPHVLALPFALLALGFVFDWWRHSPAIGLLKRDPASWARVAAGALVVGALYAINSWDFPLYLVLAAVALTRPAWWGWVAKPSAERPELVDSVVEVDNSAMPTTGDEEQDQPPAVDQAPGSDDSREVLARRPALVGLGALIGLSVLLFLPFYLSFASFAGNASVRLIGGLERVPLLSAMLRMLGVVTWERTNLGEYLQIWGFLNVAAVAWLVWLGARGLRVAPNMVGLVLVGIGLAGVLLGSAPVALAGATALLALAVLRFGRVGPTEALTCLLVAVGAGLIVGPEFFFLQDVFADRMNTIFKAYYQAWAIHSLVGALGVGATAAAVLSLGHAKATPRQRLAVIAGSAVVGCTLLLTLGYPLLATSARADRFAKRPGLDGLGYIAAQPDERAGLTWLAANVPAGTIVAEDPGHSYGEHFGLPHARASTIAGTLTPVGWPGHQSQWRANQPALLAELNTRVRDTTELYSTTDMAVAKRILDRYAIEYVYVGLWERAAENRLRARQAVYSPPALAKFDQFMDIAFQQGDVTIYRRRPN